MNPDHTHEELQDEPANPSPAPDDEPEVLPDDPDLEGLPGEDKLPG